MKEFLKKSKCLVRLYEAIMLMIYKLKAILKRKYYLLNKKPKSVHYYGQKNKDRIFFVIPSDKNCGLYSNILESLVCVEHALKRGYIPVFDYKNNFAPMIQDEDKSGLENAWEYYYEQPMKVSLEEVYQSKNVVFFNDEEFLMRRPDWREMFPASNRDLQKWHKVIVDNFRLQKPLKERVEREAARLFDGKREILGVGVRAGFRASHILKKALIEGHPIIPTCEEMIQIVEKKMQEWNYEFLFLSCDDREYQQKFLKYFGDKCIVLERHLKHYFENDIPMCTEENLDWYLREYQGISKREEVAEYLVEVYLLSKCDSLYSCIGGGAQFAYFLNGGKYKHLGVYNEGLIHL